jgi:hypothetical protein
MLTVSGAAAVPAPEHFFAGDQGSGHYGGNMLKDPMLAGERFDHAYVFGERELEDLRYVDS